MTGPEANSRPRAISRRNILAGLVATTAAFPGGTLANDFPNKPIHVISPFGPSGSPDLIARVIAEAMSDDLGQRVVVENRSGGSGSIAFAAGARASADGYTVILTSEGTHAVVPALYSNLSFNVLTDFSPVIYAAYGDMFLVVNSALGVKTLAEFVALAKSKPGVIRYGSPGLATIHHLGMARLTQMAGLDLPHVPYRGLVQGTPALLANEVSVMFATLASIAPHVQAGTLRILAVGSSERSTFQPNVPAISESGFAGFELPTNLGFLVPAGTPLPIIGRLNRSAAAALKSPRVIELAAKMAHQPHGGTPEDFTARIKTDQEIYRNLVRETGVKLP
jgi:tripartite-type tricarboxylate transporter receptor subunit TctC